MRILLGLLAAATLASGLEAQTVRGQLSDSVSRSPLSGAFVTLVDEGGAERARAITDAAGQFIVTAPSAGSYRLRSKRIGFRPYLSPALALQTGATTTYAAVIDPIPIALAEVVVEGDRHCDVVSGASVAAVWQEIREALAAAAWTSRVPNYQYEITYFQRELTPGGRPRGPDSTWRESAYQPVPVQSAAPAQLETAGYVIVDDSGWTYWGPDADVLLSEPFLRTHCFETRSGGGETEGLVGLVFTSARGRTLPDITGTLWVDRKTSELHHLEYTYIRLPQALFAPRAGGRIAFLRLPSGAWIVRDWVIRMPIARIAHPTAAPEGRPEIVAFRESGGSAVEIKTKTGTVVYRAEPAAETVAAAAPPVPPAPPAPPPAQTPGVPPAPLPPRVPVSSRGRNLNVIDIEEIERSTARDAYALVQESRPNWLHSRGAISILDPNAGSLQVYLNSTRYGDVNRLREIRTNEIRELRYLSASEAHMRYGVDNAGPVIEIWTR